MIPALVGKSGMFADVYNYVVWREESPLSDTPIAMLGTTYAPTPRRRPMRIGAGGDVGEEYTLARVDQTVDHARPPSATTATTDTTAAATTTTSHVSMEEAAGDDDHDPAADMRVDGPAVVHQPAPTDAVMVEWDSAERAAAAVPASPTMFSSDADDEAMYAEARVWVASSRAGVGSNSGGGGRPAGRRTGHDPHGPVQEGEEAGSDLGESNDFAAAAAAALANDPYAGLSDDEARALHVQAVADMKDAFLHDLYSRVWLTYRRGFHNIGNSKHSNDVGWGCMLRSGQMFLAQALVVHNLGRGWRYGLAACRGCVLVLCVGSCVELKTGGVPSRQFSVNSTFYFC